MHSSLDVIDVLITWSSIVFTPCVALQGLKNDTDRITLNQGKLSFSERREWTRRLTYIELPRNKENPRLKTFQDWQVKHKVIDAHILKFMQINTSLVATILLAL